MLQAHLLGRNEAQRVVTTGSAGVGQLLALAGVDGNILLLGGLADDHALIDGNAGADEQRAAALGVIQAVSNGLAGLTGHQSAHVAAAQLAAIGGVGVKHRGHNALALGVGQELVAVAEQAAGGHQEGQLGTGGAQRSHVEEVALAGADLLDDGTGAVAGHIHHKALHGLALLAVDLLQQHTRGADLELIAFAAHGLDQDGQVHLAASGHIQGGVGAFDLGDAQGHVLQRLAHQTVADLAGGDVLALAAGEGRVVDGEGHLNGGGADLDELQRLHGVRGADGVADGDVADAGHGNDVAGGDGVHGDAVQTVELIDRGGLGLLAHLIRIVVVAHHNLLVLLQSAALDAAHSDAAHELIIINGGDEHLERRVHVHVGGGDIIEDGVEQRLQVVADLLGIVAAAAVAGRAEQHGGIQLIVGGVQVDEQLQHLVDDLIDALVGAVDLVDHHDDPVAQLQGAGQHEAGLGHGALGGVHQQDDAVDHLQDALHLATEVGVARSVHNVDLGVAVGDGGILGHDRDAALTLQIVGVHHPVHDLLILAVNAALLQQRIHQSGLAMVNVGDDGHISQLLLNHTEKIPPQTGASFSPLRSKTGPDPEI